MHSFIMYLQVCLKHVKKSTYNTRVLDHFYLSLSALLLLRVVATHYPLGVPVRLLLVQVARTPPRARQVAGKPVLLQLLGSGGFFPLSLFSVGSGCSDHDYQDGGFRELLVESVI